MFKKKHEPIFSLDYFGEMNFDISFGKNLSIDNIANIASFIYLLTYHSPISSEVIEKIIAKKSDLKDTSTIDNILKSWATIYSSNKNDPIVTPMTAFKHNAK